MGKAAKLAFETTWVNKFFRSHDCDIRYQQGDLRAWKVSLLDITEVGRSGIVIDGGKCRGQSTWWTVEGYNEDGELFHLSVIAATDDYFVDIVDVERRPGDDK